MNKRLDRAETFKITEGRIGLTKEEIKEAKELLNMLGCGKKMRYPQNRRVQEYYECGDVVQTNWASGFTAQCKDCKKAREILQEILK